MSQRILEDVRAAWGDVFGAAPADPERDFFDCGGNSLLAIRLQQAVLVRTGAALSIAELLRHRTVAAQAAHIADAATAGPGPDPAPAPNTDPGPDSAPPVEL
ncbi:MULTISPECIES: acyl carrier protein [unclassified Streptomyces]|uniref:acyl carrier protein n=1 Tax=unclassified Streptomyces TaxID=2593676 RepID=UPI0015CF514E|nr:MULTISPECIES: acyl carrier protein [unclassified Streptomyces]